MIGHVNASPAATLIPSVVHQYSWMQLLYCCWTLKTSLEALHTLTPLNWPDRSRTAILVLASDVGGWRLYVWASPASSDY